MGRWTIGRMMCWIAGVAVGLAGLIALDRMEERPGCGRNTQCASNQRNVALATLLYANATGSLPRGTWLNPALAPEQRLSWYYAISPYLDEQQLHDKINPNGSWSSPTNAPIATRGIGGASCPNLARPPAVAYFPTAYIGIAGFGADAPTLPAGHPRAGVFGYDRQTRLKDITDGASCTMLLAESERVVGSWLSGGPATVRGLDPSDPPYIGPGRQFGLHETRWGRGANVAFADGSIRCLSESIDPKVFEALSTIAGGETVPKEAFP